MLYSQLAFQLDDMTTITPSLAGHRGLRGDILLELKRSQPLTAKQLADLFGVSANAVRRHLKELEVERLVAHGREQRGAGAPAHSFRLTLSGESLFPTRYGEALAEVLSYLAARGGRDAVRALFAERFRAQAEKLQAEFEDASLEDRVAAVVNVLSQQGFMAAWTVGDDGLHLAEHNCAVRQVAEQFPEICAAEAEFLREVLQTDVRRHAYIPDGCNACQYTIASGERVNLSSTIRRKP
jgi:DeoR family suf operon transcriptional repressor